MLTFAGGLTFHANHFAGSPNSSFSSILRLINFAAFSQFSLPPGSGAKWSGDSARGMVTPMVPLLHIVLYPSHWYAYMQV
jgi:hypothetical protein